MDDRRVLGANRWRRFDDWDERPLRLDNFAVEDPDNGFAAFVSPHDPRPGLSIADGRVVSMDGIPEAEFDIVDLFIARHHLDPAVAEEAMAMPSAEIARMLVDMNVPRAELVRLAHGMTPAKLAEVVAQLSAVEITFAPTNGILARIAAGETADVAIITRAALNDLAAKGMVLADSIADIAVSRVGIAVKAGAAKPDIATVDALKAALLAARSVAYSQIGVSGVFFAELMRRLGSEHIGVCVDTGNNIALLDDPLETVTTLAPWAFSCHLKDMGVAECPDGFLLSEVPLGEGLLDLGRIVKVLREGRPKLRFNLEMITRDPLLIPCLQDGYWATFGGVPVRLVTAKTLWNMKKDTLRPTDRYDAEVLAERFGFRER